jgi:hypothetical protein
MQKIVAFVKIKMTRMIDEEPMVKSFGRMGGLPSIDNLEER